MKRTSKSIDLPAPIAAYFVADMEGGEAFMECFADLAVVKDEGHTYQGKAAITQWKAEASNKYEYTCEPIACEPLEGAVVVTSTVRGNFPGSPVDLRFVFGLANDKIESLEIGP